MSRHLLAARAKALADDSGHVPARSRSVHPPGASVRIGLASSPPTRSSNGSTMRSRQGLRRALCTARQDASSVLAVVVEKQKIVHNACDRVDPPRVPKRGELVGLRRANVDVSRHKVRVTEHLVQLTDRSFVRRPPKTAARRRSITISPFTADILCEHLERSATTARTGSCSRMPPATRCPHQAPSPTTSTGLSDSQASRVAFATCGTRAFAVAIAAGAHPEGHTSANGACRTRK
jgi:hypothetical protein